MSGHFSVEILDATKRITLNAAHLRFVHHSVSVDGSVLEGTTLDVEEPTSKVNVDLPRTLEPGTKAVVSFAFDAPLKTLNKGASPLKVPLARLD